MTRNRAAIIVTLLLLTLSGAVVQTWRAFHRSTRVAIAGQVDMIADHAAARLEDYVHSRLLILEVIREDLQAGRLADRESFQAYTWTLQEQFGGFQAINRVNADGIIRWVSPLPTNEGAVGNNVFDHPVAGDILRSVQADRLPKMTPPLDLFQGGRAFTTYYPVMGSESRPLMYVNGVFMIDRLVEGALAHGFLDRFDILITDDGEHVFGSNDAFNKSADAGASGTAVVELLGRNWNLRIAPTPAVWNTMDGGPHLTLLIGGLALMTTLCLLLYVAILRRA